jgi:hypothetical protein
MDLFKNAGPGKAAARRSPIRSSPPWPFTLPNFYKARRRRPVFSLFIKLWFWYVSTTRRQKTADTANAVMEAGGVAGLPAGLYGRPAAGVQVTRIADLVLL